MNHRVVAVAVLSLFVSCFIGTLAFGALTFIEKVRESVAMNADPSPPPEPDAPPQATPEEPAQEEPDQPPAEATEPTEAYAAPLIATAQFAVFHLERAKVDPWKALQKAVKGTKLEAFQGEAPLTANPPYVVLRELPIADYAVIVGPALDEARVSPAVKKALPRARAATVIDVVLPLHDASLREVSKAMAALVAATGGVVWDEECQEYYDLATWNERRVASWENAVPEATMHYVVYQGSNDRGVDFKTAGLSHLGLPELALNHVPVALKDQGLWLLHLVAQLLFEGGTSADPGPMLVRLEDVKHGGQRGLVEAELLAGATREADVVLAGAHDGKRPVLAITFPGNTAVAGRAQKVLGSFFGTAEE